MKLEGVHHITAITADAQANVDFYAGTLGLRMVKKTVNQDAPSVYHLFYADEQGDPGLRHHVLRVPRRAPGAAPAPGWSIGSSGGSARPESLDFWAERLAAAGREPVRERRPAALLRPRGPRARARRRRRRRPATDRRPSGGARRARAPGLPRRPRLLRRPRARAPGCSSSSSSSAPTTAGRPAATPAEASGSTTSRPPSAGSRAPARSTTSPGPRRPTSTSTGASGRSRAARARPRSSTASGFGRSTSASRAECCSRSRPWDPDSASTRIPSTWASG